MVKKKYFIVNNFRIKRKPKQVLHKPRQQDSRESSKVESCLLFYQIFKSNTTNLTIISQSVLGRTITNTIISVTTVILVKLCVNAIWFPQGFGVNVWNKVTMEIRCDHRRSTKVTGTTTWFIILCMYPPKYICIT